LRESYDEYQVPRTEPRIEAADDVSETSQACACRLGVGNEQRQRCGVGREPVTAVIASFH